MYFVGTAVPPESIRVNVPPQDTVYPTVDELAQFCASSSGPMDIFVLNEEKNCFEIVGQTMRCSLKEQPPRLLVTGGLFAGPQTEAIRKDPTKWGLGLITTYSLNAGHATEKHLMGLFFTLSPEKGATLHAATRSETRFKEIMTEYFDTNQ